MKNKKKCSDCCENTVNVNDATETVTVSSSAPLVLSIVSICLTAVLAIAAVFMALTKKVVYIESDN